MSPTLYLFIGYPGAGKTTVAQAIARATGAVHIWADTERHKLFPNPSHSHAESVQLYDVLNRRTSDLLSQGKSVVFDTNFNFYKDREVLRKIAVSTNAKTVIVWIDTAKDIAKNRAVHAQITRNGYEFAMNDQQFETIADKLEPPHENEKVIKIDGTKFDETSLPRLLKTE